jgi:hypothetical protein
MAYFTMIMVSTLWVTSVFGEDRVVVGALVIGAWLLPMLIRRLRRDPSAARGAERSPRLRVATASAGEPSSAPAPRASSRKASSTHTGRRRRTTRGLHR